ncbi:DUF2510 domain-containing protein [Leifsonia shinshuensis]|uniref:DUF2510 domain-containing protein n=1 Tax=Leifsonia shinshuensis TaxID=150026 RepID=A0A853D127_9MICO|nr:hypothetical protein [Leifsonia shinshuensis]
MTDAVLPPAGWYEDPDPNRADGSHRWWNGSAWTEHVRTTSPALQMSPAPSAIAPEPLPYENTAAPLHEEVAYVPFASRRAAVEAEYPRRQSAASPRNSHAFVGRGLSLLAVMVSIVTVIMLDVATHIPGQDWSAYVSLAGVVIAPGLAIAGIVFSAIGLARYRTRGNGGVAAAGLTLGILFTFAPFWIGLVLGIIAGFIGRVA